MVLFKIKNFGKEKKFTQVVNVTYVEKEIKKKKVEKEIKKKKVEKEIKKKKVEKKPKKSISEKNLKKPIPKNIKTTKKEKPKKNTKKFDDMLKNLASEDLDNNNSIDDKIKNLSKKEILDKTNSASTKEIKAIMNLLMNQINNNWTRPPAIKGYENLVIKIDIYLNPNGSVYAIVESPDVKKLMADNEYLKPLLDSAIRAIKKSSPFEGIQKYSYNKWKKNTINFRPFENIQ